MGGTIKVGGEAAENMATHMYGKMRVYSVLRE